MEDRGLYLPFRKCWLITAIGSQRGDKEVSWSDLHRRKVTTATLKRGEQRDPTMKGRCKHAHWYMNQAIGEEVGESTHRCQGHMTGWMWRMSTWKRKCGSYNDFQM